MSVQTYIKEQIAYQERIRELEELVLRHGRLWAKLDLALGDKRMAGDLTCADAAIKRIRELEAERDALREESLGRNQDCHRLNDRIRELEAENNQLKERIAALEELAAEAITQVICRGTGG